MCDQEKIYRLNNEFRQSFCGADAYKSPVLAALSVEVREDIYSAIRLSNYFDPETTNHPEHNFGTVRVHDHHITWAIGYMDKASEELSQDPSNPAVTTRIIDLMTTTEKTAELNDILRTFGVGGECFMSQGFAALKQDVRLTLIQAIRDFEDFDPENDPYGEHNAGMVEVDGRKAFWRIDYYNKEKTQGSEAPWDTEETARVMTIMLASDL